MTIKHYINFVKILTSTFINNIVDLCDHIYSLNSYIKTKQLNLDKFFGQVSFLMDNYRK